MKKKLLAVMMSVTVVMSLVAGCGETGGVETGEVENTDTNVSQESDEVADITIQVMQNKIEGADALKDLASMYEAETGIKVEFTALGSGDYPSTLTARIQSGDAPDLFTSAGYADFDNYFDMLENLNNESWVEYLIPDSAVGVTRDGEVYGIPISIEGTGYIYNKSLFEQAGITKLPNTLEELEQVCVTLEAAGIRPFTNAYAEFWILMQNFTAVMGTVDNPQEFYDSLMAGETHFKDIENIEHYMDQIDLTVKYGQNNCVVAGDQTSTVAAFVNGESAMYQNGTWAQNLINEMGGVDFEMGYLPIIGTDGEENRMAGGAPMYWVVNKESEHLEETKAFLEWMVQNEGATAFLTEKMGYLPSVTNVDVQPEQMTELNARFYEYSSQGLVIPFTSGIIPGDGNPVIFAELQKYIAGQISREEFYEAAQAKLETLK